MFENPNQQKRKEIRENLYEKVDFKVDTIMQLRKFISENSELSPENLHEKLIAKFENIKKEIGPEVGKNFEIYYTAKQIGIDLYNKWIGLTDFEEKKFMNENGLSIDDKDDWEFEFYEQLDDSAEYKKIEKERDQVHEEINKWKENEDIIFLEKIYSLIESIVEKRKQVLEIQPKLEKNPDYFFDLIGRKKEDFKEEPVIEFSGININVILSPEDYAKARNKKSNGVHFSGTVINLISDRAGKEETINHEEIHNLTESFVEYRPAEQAVDLIEEDLKKIEYFKKRNDPDFVIEGRKQLLSKRIQDYFKLNYGEIVADIDRLPRGELGTYLSNFSAIQSKLHDLLDGLEDKKLEEELRFFVEKQEKAFLKFFFTISNIFYVANKINKVEEAKALIILFKNEGIGKAERQMKHYDERYDSFVSVKRLIGTGDLFKNSFKADEIKVGEAKEEYRLAEMLLKAIFSARKNIIIDEFKLSFNDLDDFLRIEKLVSSGAIKDENEKDDILTEVTELISDLKRSKKHLEVGHYNKLMICFKNIEKELRK